MKPCRFHRENFVGGLVVPEARFCQKLIGCIVSPPVIRDHTNLFPNDSSHESIQPKGQWILGI